MKHFLTYLISVLLPGVTLCAQSYDVPLEDLDETEVESLEHAQRHPVHINTASRNGLLRSGLFTPLQVENLLEYRKRSGDILSAVEFSLIDGFTIGDTKKIVPYIDFQESRRMNGADADLTLRSGWKGKEWSGAAMKSELAIGDAASLYYSTRFGESPFWSHASFSIALSPGVHLEQLIIGDYSLRFGQGLGCWSGMTMTTLSSVNAFMRRPTGLKQSHSLPPSENNAASYRRGLAADIVLQRWTFTPFISFSGSSALRPGMHARFLSCSGEYGITAGGGLPLSFDCRQYFRGFDLFGEWLPLGREPPGALTASQMATFVAGTVWNMSYDSKIALRLRNLPAKEHSAALGLKLKSILLSADFQQLPPKDGWQCKLLLDASSIPLNGWWSIGLRLKERLRSYGNSASLADIRLDNSFSYASFLRTNLRLEASCDRGFRNGSGTSDPEGEGVKPGGLAYLEQGCVWDRCSIWGRVTVWDIPSWEERIYVYERDAPQCFNMRAYYRRGVSCSLYASFKTDRLGRFYLRLSAHDSRIQYALSF